MLDSFDALVISGSRMVLRSVELRDAQGLFNIIDSSRQHLEPWLPWVDYVRTSDDERHMVEQWIYDMQIRTAIQLCVTIGDELVGIVGTHQIDWINQRTSIGYWIGEKHIRKGYATEATAILLSYLFERLRLHRVFIQAATKNEASNRVIEKLGFKWEGLLRENERVKDLYLDHNIYGMTHNDFSLLKAGISRFLKE